MRRAIGIAALLAVAAQVLLLAPRLVTRSVMAALNGVVGAADSPIEARRRVFGRIADALEAIKRVLPEHSEYLLAGDNVAGELYFAAYDLAPRRVRSVGSGWCTEEELRANGLPPDAPRYVVIVPSKPGVPHVVETEVFFGSAR